MDSCGKHIKSVAGVIDMKQLAEMIGDLHYEILGELVKQLWLKLDKDGHKDIQSGRIKLGCDLLEASTKAFLLYEEIQKVWEISKPFMSKKN